MKGAAKGSSAIRGGRAAGLVLRLCFRESPLYLESMFISGGQRKEPEVRTHGTTDIGLGSRVGTSAPPCTLVHCPDGRLFCCFQSSLFDSEFLPSSPFSGGPGNTRSQPLLLSAQKEPPCVPRGLSQLVGVSACPLGTAPRGKLRPVRPRLEGESASIFSKPAEKGAQGVRESPPAATSL